LRDIHVFKYLIPLLLLATPAFAQQAPPQPSQQALIEALHTELVQQGDALTLAQARYMDAEQQIATLQAAAQKSAATAVKRK
jgi:hypothetical protein